MHDQLKPNRLTRRNNDILRLSAEPHYRIATARRKWRIQDYPLISRDGPAVGRIDDCDLMPHQSGLGFSVFFDQLPRNRFH